MKTIFYAESVAIVATIILILATISVPDLLLVKTTIASADEQRDSTITNGTNFATTTANTTRNTGPAIDNNTSQNVAVGGGNTSISVNQFSPQTVQIQSGENVTFFAPSGSIELHNVIFDQSNGTIVTDVGVPFTLPPGVSQEDPTDISQELLPVSPYNLGEPIIQNTSTTNEDPTQAIVGFNKIAFYPSIVDQYGNVRYLGGVEEESSQFGGESSEQQEMSMSSNLSTNYTIDGTETLVSSGIILDAASLGELNEAEAQQQQAMTAAGEGEQILPPQYPLTSNFTITFSEPGTYNYFCAFHPAMFGQVIVR
jgi:plastocyanin